ncbi:hypothetical protein Slin15195_G048450 [Septoria linicola]|uniref:Uncharacterized protein n=1 Tax=Septoria linicola TaxID=215465 RepID=A0A9Q9EH73_9PEZI|nr:hypothetical protein Slin15195_G048450 [Septoria linicola]
MQLILHYTSEDHTLTSLSQTSSHIGVDGAMATTWASTLSTTTLWSAGTNGWIAGWLVGIWVGEVEIRVVDDLSNGVDAA